MGGTQPVGRPGAEYLPWSTRSIIRGRSVLFIVNSTRILYGVRRFIYQR